MARLTITAPFCAFVVLTVGAAACIAGAVVVPVLPLLPLQDPQINTLAKTNAVTISTLIRT
ncbi:MAG: hypothetical protein WBQ95_21985 [Terracidiphilus sp.]